MLKWNLVVTKNGMGFLYFETPADSLEDLVEMIKKDDGVKPTPEGYTVIEYDSMDQHDPRGVKTTKVQNINTVGDIMIDFIGCFPGILVSNPPLTKTNN